MVFSSRIAGLPSFRWRLQGGILSFVLSQYESVSSGSTLYGRAYGSLQVPVCSNECADMAHVDVAYETSVTDPGAAAFSCFMLSESCSLFSLSLFCLPCQFYRCCVCAVMPFCQWRSSGRAARATSGWSRRGQRASFFSSQSGHVAEPSACGRPAGQDRAGLSLPISDLETWCVVLLVVLCAVSSSCAKILCHGLLRSG